MSGKWLPEDGRSGVVGASYSHYVYVTYFLSSGIVLCLLVACRASVAKDFYEGKEGLHLKENLSTFLLLFLRNIVSTTTTSSLLHSLTSSQINGSLHGNKTPYQSIPITF